MATTSHSPVVDNTSDDTDNESEGDQRNLLKKHCSPGNVYPTIQINENSDSSKKCDGTIKADVHSSSDSPKSRDGEERSSTNEGFTDRKNGIGEREDYDAEIFERNSPSSIVYDDDADDVRSHRCRSVSESYSTVRPSSMPTVSFASGRVIHYSDGEVERVDDDPDALSTGALSDSEVTSRHGRSVPTTREAVPFSMTSRSRFHSEAKTRRLTRGVKSASTQSLPALSRGSDVAVDFGSSETGRKDRPSGESGDAEEKSFGLWAMSHKEKLALVCLFLVDLSAQMCLSIMAPFFPSEAGKKHVSSTVSGWIFGVFALVQFIASPFFGKILPHVGSRFMITAGQFFSGGCIVLFGLLDYVETSEESTTFIVLCFVLRVCLALGCTASSTASFAVTANIFPDHVSTVFGLLETATGLGMMTGPALGGVLYQAGGFILPFAVIGGFMLLSVPVNFCCLPVKDDNSESTLPVSLLQIMRIPAIIVICLAVIMSATLWSIMDPTLAPHLQVFKLSPTVLGLLFLLMSALYAIFSPFWGWLSDKLTDSSPLIAVGFLVCAVGLLLLGPSSLLGFSNDYASLPMNIVALGILGISVSLAIVPTFDKILDVVEKAGIEESFSMYSYVAGIWGGCYALGEFIGPSFGGMLVDAIGFPLTMTYTAGACVVMALILLVHATYTWYQRGRRQRHAKQLQPTAEFDSSEIYSNERTPLLNPSMRPNSVPIAF